MLLYFNEYVNDKLFEGGNFGHIDHPYDDKNLKFSDIKEIINLSLNGNLNKEVSVSEKLDGIALAFTYKAGQVLFSRNKSHRENSAAYALTVTDLINKFKGKDYLDYAFEYAVSDINKLILKLDPKQLESIFSNGKKFANIEVIYPRSSNVINYDTAYIIFHNLEEYDEKGKKISEDSINSITLYNIVQEVNKDTRRNFVILPPTAINLPKHIDFSEKKEYFINKVEILQKEWSLKNSNTIGDYLYEYFEIFVNNEIRSTSAKLTKEQKEGIINRLAYKDKSYSLKKLKNDVVNYNFVYTISQYFENKNYNELYRKAIYPIEMLFLELGIVVLKNASGFLAANPDKVIQDIKNNLDQVIHKIELSGNTDDLIKAYEQLDKINELGGFDNIIPTEGVIFMYKGKKYKLTGSFGPINKVLGLIKFRKNKTKTDLTI